MLNSSDPPRFRSRQIKRQTLDADEDSCCVLSQSLDILYCNPAWDAFACANGGGAAAQAANLVGCNLLQFIPAPLQKFFSEHLSLALGDFRIWDHFYECSSPSEFRVMRLQALPLLDASELLIAHTVMYVGPHYRAPSTAAFSDKRVHMCGHCRRSAGTDGLAEWLWVPEHLARPPLNCANTLCPECANYYAGGCQPWPATVWRAPSWAAGESRGALG
jgi:hypothetical protein